MMTSDMDKAEMQKRLGWYFKKYGPYVEKRGAGNWRNLFLKPTLYEWTILFMIFMALFIGWAYQVDTAQCRETLTNLEATCLDYCGLDSIRQPTEFNYPDLNITKFKITADNNPLNEGT